MLGDFNAGPLEKEVSAREGLFTVLRSEDVTDAKRTHYGRASPPLVNLMAHVAAAPEHGTLFLQGKGWIVCDQIAVSEDIEPAVDRMPLTMRELQGKSLVTTSRGRPKHSTYSDHLPVQVTIRV